MCILAGTTYSIPWPGVPWSGWWSLQLNHSWVNSSFHLLKLYILLGLRLWPPMSCLSQPLYNWDDFSLSVHWAHALAVISHIYFRDNVRYNSSNNCTTTCSASHTTESFVSLSISYNTTSVILKIAAISSSYHNYWIVLLLSIAFPSTLWKQKPLTSLFQDTECQM